uniref:Uncharacterized protein n=1 Tax=Aegilops tauschii subsp. strangulata TaxID=200361 RepID=A0A453PJC7_AEGTS
SASSTLYYTSPTRVFASQAWWERRGRLGRPDRPSRAPPSPPRRRRRRGERPEPRGQLRLSTSFAFSTFLFLRNKDCLPFLAGRTICCMCRKALGLVGISWRAWFISSRPGVSRVGSCIPARGGVSGGANPAVLGRVPFRRRFLVLAAGAVPSRQEELGFSGSWPYSFTAISSQIGEVASGIWLLRNSPLFKWFS